MANCNCDPNECSCAQTKHVYQHIPLPDDPCKVIGGSDDGCGVDWKYITAECVKLPDGYSFCGKTYNNLAELLDDVIVSVGCTIPTVEITKSFHYPNATQDGAGVQVDDVIPVLAGTVLWVKITITNTDLVDDIDECLFSDVLDPGLFNTNSTPFPQSTGLIPAGGSYEFEFQVQIDPSLVFQGIGIITNTATVDSVNGRTVENIYALEAVRVENPILTCTKVADAASYTVGDDITYTLAVKNIAQYQTATTVIITDTLPASMQYNTGSASQVPTSAPVIPGGTITWDIGTIAPGQTVNIGYTCEALTATASAENFAQAAHDHGLASDSDPVVILALNAPLLGVAKTVDVSDVVQGATQTWTITITNTGGDTVAGDVGLVDFIPVNSSFDVGSATVEINGGGAGGVTPVLTGTPNVDEAITFSAAMLGGVVANGDTVEVVFTTTADLVGSESNLARVTWTGVGSPAEDTVVTNISAVGAPLMDISKTSDVSSLLIGEEVTFTVASQNVGAATTSSADVEVIDQLPAQLGFVTGSGEFQINGGGWAPLAPTVGGGPGGELLTFAIAAAIAVSDTVEVRYKATALAVAATADNSAVVEWNAGVDSTSPDTVAITVTGGCFDDPDGLLGEFGTGTVICADINPSDVNGDSLTGVIYDSTSAFTVNGGIYGCDNGGFVYEFDPDSGGVCPVHANAGFPPTGWTGVVYMTEDAGRPHNPGTYPWHDLEDITVFTSPLSLTKRYYTAGENAKEIRVLDAAWSELGSSPIDLGAYIAYTSGPANDYEDARNAGTIPLATGKSGANDLPGMVNVGVSGIAIYEDSDSKVWMYASTLYDGSIYRKELTSGSDFTQSVTGVWEFVSTPSNAGTVATPGVLPASANHPGSGGAFGSPEGDGADFNTSTFYANYFDAGDNPGGPATCASVSPGGPVANPASQLTGIYALGDYLYVVHTCASAMYAIHLAGTNKHKVQQVWDLTGTDLESVDISGMTFGEWGGNRYLYISTYSNSLVRYPWPVCLD